MAGILEYSTTPASNTTINGIGISGSSSVKYGDDAIRQFMADVRSAVTKASDKAAGTHMATKADHNQLWRVTGNATINLTSAATLTAGWSLWVMADGGTATIDPASSEQINGAATLTLSDGNAAFIICTATAFRAVIFNGPVIVGTTPGTVADGVAALQYKGAIGASEDLDTYTTPGIYVQNQSAGASGGTNYPVANAGMLEVLDGGGATNVQCVQRYTEYSQPTRLYARMKRNNGVWSAWINLFEDIVSQAEAEAGTATDRRAWTAERVRQNASAIAIGVGQTWQDVSGSRSIGTSYQNTTGRSIEVSVTVVPGPSANAQPALQVSDNNSTWVSVDRGQDGADFLHGSAIIPPGHYYRVNVGASILIWSELR